MSKSDKKTGTRPYRAVTVQAFPAVELDAIRAAVKTQGVRDADASAIKYAAIQWLRAGCPVVPAGFAASVAV
jgi:hypothetical protein